MPAPFDPQELLARDDKWFIAGGRELIYAPELPLWTDVPGFWPYATWLEWRVGPAFTVTILDENGEELPLELTRRRWTPSHVTQEYALPGKLRLVERRAMTANDALVSELTLRNGGSKRLKLNVVVWTSVPTRKDAPGTDFATGFERAGERFVWTRRIRGEKGELHADYAVALGISPAPATTCVSLSEEAQENVPWWRWTPFYWKMRPEGLPNELVTEGGHLPGMAKAFLFAAQHVTLRLPAGGRKTVTAAASVASTRARCLEQLDEALAARRPIEEAIGRCKAFFDSVPRFRCTDPYIERAYWYRWWGLYLGRVMSGHDSLRYPCVFEGMNPGWFRHAISYSAQCHMLECRWMHDPALAQGSLLNFIRAQRDDGSLPGGILPHASGPTASSFIYHVNWGFALRKLDEIHPDGALLDQVYEPLAKYARYFDLDRDREHSGLYDVVWQGETGQEYMGRYSFVDETADQWGQISPPLKGVDATVYIYELKRQLAWIAARLGKKGDASAWTAEAEAIKQAVRDKMWDRGRTMFCDVHPQTWQRSPHAAAVHFYPFMTDLAGPEHLAAIHEHLLNADEFWLPYPVPSTGARSPLYDADGQWKGERKHCPWSGVVWLMTNSHLAEALANAAFTLDETLRPRVAELVTKTIRMLFTDGHLDRPTSYEYYSPLNGKAPFFRAVDDYMHSWIVELILKYLAGVQTLDGDRLVVEPLDFGLKAFTVEKLRVRGRDITITWRARKTDAAPKGLTVGVDGKRRAHADALCRLEVHL
jgi:hypothetical protein